MDISCVVVFIEDKVVSAVDVDSIFEFVEGEVILIVDVDEDGN